MVDLSYTSEVRFILNVLKFTNLKGMLIRVSWLNKLAVKFPAFLEATPLNPTTGCTGGRRGERGQTRENGAISHCKILDHVFNGQYPGQRSNEEQIK